MGQFGHPVHFWQFFLLFQVVWFVWRDVAYFINVFSLETDLAEKLSLYFIMVILVNIGLSAHTAFSKTVRWTSFSAFAVQLYTGFTLFITGSQSKTIGTKNIFKNMLMNQGLFGMIMSVPYLVSGIINEGSAAIVCFWVAVAMQATRTIAFPQFILFVTRKLNQKVLPALSIEAFTEKFGLFTLITLGEGFIALLFEAALVADDKRAKAIAGVGFLGLLITYCLMTVYFNVDNQILIGGKHAIRKKAIRGVFWSITHLLYHACLILGATALGQVLRVTALSVDNEEDNADEAERFLLDAFIRAEAEEGGNTEFDAKWRWLLCVGYGCALLFSGVLSFLHDSGPLAITKPYRLAARAVVVVATVLTAIPLSSSLTALGYLGAVTIVVGMVSLVEFILLQADRLQIWPHISYSDRLAGLSELPRSISSDSAPDSIFQKTRFTNEACTFQNLRCH